MKAIFHLSATLFRAGIALLFIALSSHIFAHEFPSEVQVITNRTVKFSVCDVGTCSAYVSATPNDTNMITITPNNGFGVCVEFSITAKTNIGTTTVTIQWIGSDKFSGNTTGPCQEDTTPAGRTMTVKVVPEPKPTSSDNNRSSHVSGDPVNTFNGELTMLEAPDIDLGGPLGLKFQRYYASRMKTGFVQGDLGDNWRHNYEWKLHWNGTLATVITPKGRVLRFFENGANNWQPLDALDTPYQLKQNGTTMSLGDPVENLIYSFDTAGRLEEISDGKGNRLTFFYYEFDQTFPGQTPGKLFQVFGANRSLYFYYSGDKLTNVFGGTLSATFNYTTNNLTSVTDAAGSITQYVYDTAHADPGLLKWKVMPEGNIPWKQTYDSVGKVATQADAFGNTTSFNYGPPQTPGTTIVTEPGGRGYTHIYDANGSLTSIIDPAGNTWNFGNDSNRRRTSIPNLQGGTLSRTFNTASGRIATQLNEAGEQILYNYQARAVTNGITFYDISTITFPNGSVESFFYDSSGNATSRVDRAGNTWTWTYNANGLPTSSFTPEGGKTTNTYNSALDLLTTRDNANNLTQYSYDSQYRLTQILFADGNSRRFGYDNLNRRTFVRDERGNTNFYAYDRNGNLRTNTYQATNRIVYTYNAMDYLVSATDAKGEISRTGYDALQRFASTTNRVGGVQTNGFDLLDHMTSVTDEAGKKWQLSYNTEGWLTSKTDPLNNTTTQIYDSVGRLSRKISPLQNETKYTYNSLGQIASFRDAQGELSSFSYDPRGLVSSLSIANGLISASYLRNKMGLITNVTDANGKNWRFAYDPQGRLTNTTDPNGNVTTQQYNNRNRPSVVTFPGAMGTMNVTYDGVGNITQRSFSDGLIRNYTYDANNRCTSATGVSLAYDNRKSLTNCNGMTITRDAEDRIQSITFAVGKTVTYSYNSRRLLSNVSDWAGGGMQFVYDDAGRLVNIVRSNAVTTTIGYNAEDRITSIQEGGLSAISLTRNNNGLVTSATRSTPLSPNFSAGTNTYTYDNASQLNGSTYDAMGRLTSGNGRTLTWNLASRVTSYTEASTNVTLTYDGLGNVLSRNGRDYVWNYAFSLPAISIVRSSGSDLRYYIHSPDGRLLYAIEAGTNARHYYHFDEVGSTLFLTSDAGTITDSYAYRPYGELSNSSGSFENPFTFQGRFGVMTEGNTGLYLMRQRLYDSVTKRFLSREQFPDLMHPAKLNPYQYALCNPLEYVDPTGEDPEPSSGGDVTDYVGFGANYVDGVGDALEIISKEGSTAAKIGDGFGIAGHAVGAVTEVVKGNSRMDEICKKFKDEMERLRKEFDDRMKEIRLRWKRREITYDEYTARRRRYWQEMNEGMDRAQTAFNTDTVANGVITTLNLLGNHIPFLGLTGFDWSDHIQYK